MGVSPSICLPYIIFVTFSLWFTTSTLTVAMRRGEWNWFWTAIFGVPVLMVVTKGARMDAKERHEIQMRVKHRSEFWAKGNEFTTGLRDRVHKQLTASADPLWGSPQ